MKSRTSRVHLIFSFFLLCSCSDDPPVPKPVGYFRIELPTAAYQTKELPCPFVLETSELSRVDFYTGKGGPEHCWFDVVYPRLKARIHLTYIPVNGNLRNYLEEARSLTYEHQIKANKISTQVISRPEVRVYGLAYDLEGNVASAFQFYLTDSTRHFLRGSLYFEARPNADSLQPVLSYLKADLMHLISSIKWKDG